MTALSQFLHHRILHHRTRLGWAGAFAMVLASVALAHSQSAVQPKAATIHGTHFMEHKHVLCGNIAECKIRFTQVFNERELLITRVTCHVVNLATPDGVLFMILARRQSGPNATHVGPPSHLVPMRISPEKTNRHVVNSETSYLYAAGEIPQVTVTTLVDGRINYADCTLFGTLQTPRPIP